MSTRARTLLALATACAATLVAAGPAASALRQPPRLDRGIVQSVSVRRIVIAQLDGTTLAIPLDARTRVLLDGRAAAIADVRPGDVAAVVHPPGGPARAVRAFAPAAPRLRRALASGIVRAVGARGLALQTRVGIVRVAVGARTRIVLDGRPAALADLRPGFRAQVAHVGARALAIRAVSGPARRAP